MNKFIKLYDLFSLTIEALKKNRLRTFLSIVGIIIGISTLILILGIASAAQSLIRNQLASFGADTVFIHVKVPYADRGTSSTAILTGVQVKTMKLADAKGVLHIPNVKDSYGAVMSHQKVLYRDKSKRSIVFGSTPSYLSIDRSRVEIGRFFTEAENDNLARVVVLGNSVKKQLFGDSDPLGKMARISGFNFRVIGVMEKRGAVFFQNYDEYVYIPIKTEQKLLLGYDYLPYFVVQLKNASLIDLTTDDIARFLRRQHNIHGNDYKKDDFEIDTAKEAFDTINIVFAAVSILFGGIASISLIVGGVGIMNIMYVSVTERVREIGLRKAIGARRQDILLQFLLESLTLTLIGGLLGILLGALLSGLMSYGFRFAGYNLDITISPFSFLIGVTITTACGILFGYGPARKAASLQPIEALRAE